MKRIVAGTNDAGQRLDKFLFKLLDGVSGGMVYKWLRKKRVKVNGEKKDISYMIKQGDVLELYINDEFFAAKSTDFEGFENDESQVNVVYEDKNILIADKPSGMAAHGEKGCLLDCVTAYLFKKGEYVPSVENTFAPALCNRIDKNTSGLVIAAKNAAALRKINEKIRNREINKYYILKVEGSPAQKEGIIRGYTLKNEKERKVFFYDKEVPNSKPCATQYKVIDDCGTVEALLLTGRTHQIRASFSAIGHPLVGDVKYGAKKNGKTDFQQLRAYKIEFKFRTSADELDYLNGKVIEAHKEL